METILLQRNFDDIENDVVIAELLKADDLYHNGEESFITDEQYDTFKRMAEFRDPTNPYFIGVGSNVRGGKVKLPYEMGSLDQIEIGGIQKWIADNNLQNEMITITDKMDGTNALII